MTALARRTIVTGIAGLPLATILADPKLAALAAEALETVSIKTAGGRDVSAALAVPATTPAPAVLLIHEWWGLNDQIKTMAAEFAKEGFLALAVDLYGGKVATDPAGTTFRTLEGCTIYGSGLRCAAPAAPITGVRVQSAPSRFQVRVFAS